MKQSEYEILLEGTAVSWAVYTGACKSCRYLPQCETDDSFTFPNDSPCMKKKESLKSASMKGE
jgi:hypothetical protein